MRIYHSMGLVLCLRIWCLIELRKLLWTWIKGAHSMFAVYALTKPRVLCRGGGVGAQV